METLQVSYSVWKQVIQANSFTPYILSTGTNKATVWAGTDAIVYETHVTADTWDDWTTNFGSSAIDVSREHDAVAQIVGLSNIPCAPLVSPEHGLVVAPTYTCFTEQGCFKGDALDAPANSTSVTDYRISTEIYLKGGHWWIQNANWGDTVDFVVVDKDDVLGLFALYGLTPGEDVIELKKIVDEFHPVSGCSNGEYYPPDQSLVYSGLYLRAKYENNGEVDARFSVVYLCYEK